MRFFITVPFFVLGLVGCKNTPQDIDNKIDNELALRGSITNEFCGKKKVSRYDFSQLTNRVSVLCGKSYNDKTIIKLSSPFEGYTQSQVPLLSTKGIEELKFYTSEIGSRIGCSGSEVQGVKDLEVVDMGEYKKIRQVNFCARSADEDEIVRKIHRASGKEISYVVTDVNAFETYLAWLDEAQTALCGNKELSLNSMYNFSCGGSTYELKANSNISKISTYSALDCPEFGFKTFRSSGSSYGFTCKG